MNSRFISTFYDAWLITCSDTYKRLRKMTLSHSRKVLLAKHTGKTKLKSRNDKMKTKNKTCFLLNMEPLLKSSFPSIPYLNIKNID